MSHLQKLYLNSRTKILIFAAMRIDIISAVPQLLDSPFSHSIIKRAADKGLAKVIVHDLRDYTKDKHKRIDDTPFGGGAGMVMTIQPIESCINKLKSERAYDEVIYMSPDGDLFNQKMANTMSSYENIIILCGHYKGVDDRVREHLITKEISVGDYVLTGGELAAAIVADSLIRLIPDVLGDETSALTDSFQDDLLAPPVYTRPAEYNGWKVPDVLRSGNDKLVDEWRMEKAIERTEQRRPGLLD